MAEVSNSLRSPVDARQVPRLALLLLFVVSAAVLLAMPTSDVGSLVSPDSGLYLDIAERLRAGDLTALRDRRGATYPIIVAVHQGLGVPHVRLVGLFNLVGLGLLVAVLLRQSRNVTAWVIALVGLAYLASRLGVGFATSYLRESVLLGVHGVHFALLIAAFDGRRKSATRIALVAASILWIYHWKGMYLYPAACACVLWAWACLPSLAPLRRVGMALAVTVLVCVATWATNPKNDQGQIGVNLIGGFIRTPIPDWYADRPDVIDTAAAQHALAYVARARLHPEQAGELAGDGRANPFILEELYQAEYGESLAEQGKVIAGNLIARDPARYFWLMTRRTWLISKAAFLDGVVCQQPLGRPRGLGLWSCRPVAALVLLGVPVLGLAALVSVRRRPEAAAFTVGVVGIAAGLGVGIALIGYVAFDRLLLPAYLYGMLGFPLAVSLLMHEGVEQSEQA